MKLCPICCEKEANKKNVHLLPWFLIKKHITHRGTGDRDMEMSFTINPMEFTRVYTGRSVLPENVQELGDLNDLQKEKSNPYSVDDIICGDCEAKLSRLEAIFASEFNSKNLINTFAKGDRKSVV